MRAVVQRVSSASVTVDGESISSIGPGLLVLLGVRNGDTETDAVKLAGRVANLRIFSDTEGKMNLSVKDKDAEVLVVSQFTLYADTAKGRRPSFIDAAPSEVAEPLINSFIKAISEIGASTRTGRFRAHMRVELINDGPVTVILETDHSVSAG